MRVELNEIKNYLRVDHPFDDTLLTTLKKVAEGYVYSAIELETTITSLPNNTFPLETAIES